MLKIFTTVLVMATSMTAIGQIVDYKLKKKQFGWYEGVIPHYTIDEGNIMIPVNESLCQVNLKSDQMSVTLGNQMREGEYKILFSTKEYSVLEFTPQDQMMRERYILKRKGKSLTREGAHPQPSVDLKKIKKK